MTMNEATPYSVLMSVYHKEKADCLRIAIESIFSQTIKTNDFVLVCDGPLNDSLNAVIEEAQKKNSSIFHVVRLEKNLGLGRALNIGMQYCRNDIIARMDSDDVSLPQRCEKQLYVISNYDVDIVSALIQEYDSNMENPGALRIVPETHDDIIKFAKKRNPFNHPCVMYKKKAVEAAGGYQDFYLLEDYYLWIRMLMNGSKGWNIQEVLLNMRAGSVMYLRRAGFRYALSQCRLFYYMKHAGFIGYKQMMLGFIIRCVIALVPNWCRKLIYQFKLRDA